MQPPQEQKASSSRKRTKNRAAVSSCNPTPGHMYLEKTIILEATCVPVFTEALITTAETWKQAKCPSVEGWIKKAAVHTRATEYHSARKRDGITPLAARRTTNLEMIAPSKTDQKDKHHRVSFPCEI